MLGIAVIILLSWLLLYLTEKQNILALGLIPRQKSLKLLFIGFVLTFLLYLIFHTGEILLQKSEISKNKEFTIEDFLQSAWWNFRSVLTEELIFRGAVLYIAIRKFGNKWAVLASALAFGFYHWFSYGVIGQLVPMIYVFIITGLMGYALAYSFWKAKSILLPLGLHFGWNFMNNVIFANGPLTQGLLVETQSAMYNNTSSMIFSFIMHISVPLIILFWVNKYISPINVNKSEYS